MRKRWDFGNLEELRKPTIGSVGQYGEQVEARRRRRRKRIPRKNVGRKAGIRLNRAFGVDQN